MKKQTTNKIDANKLSSKITNITFWIINVLILSTMIASVIQFAVSDDPDMRGTHVSHVMLCAVAAILCIMPKIIQKKFYLYLPSALHIFILLFIYAHFILGEVQDAYNYSAVFDKILHTTSGIVIALCGFSLVNFLNKVPNSHIKLNPFFVAFFSFCFALAIALLWEIFEYASDCITGSNMQRYLPPAQVVQDVEPAQGYGLIDTMGDVIVSTCSAFVVCVFGYVALKFNSKLLNPFLLRKISDYETAVAEAEEADDKRLLKVLKKVRDKEQNKECAESIEHEEETYDAEPQNETLQS